MSATATKCRPIIFTFNSVRKILEGKKTQTRRIDKRQNDGPYCWVEDGEAMLQDEYGDVHPRPCPYGKPGERLWVRESFWYRQKDGTTWFDDGSWTAHKDSFLSAAHIIPDPPIPAEDMTIESWKTYGFKRKSPLFMPRWASRLTLEITDVRVQRVQDISEEDSQAEGCQPDTSRFIDTWNARGLDFMYRDSFKAIWDTINGKGSWELNPWVWAITFQQVKSQ